MLLKHTLSHDASTCFHLCYKFGVIVKIRSIAVTAQKGIQDGESWISFHTLKVQHREFSQSFYEPYAQSE